MRPLFAAKAAVLALFLACGSGAEVHEAFGTVKDVDAKTGQVLVDHDDIPGLMPAMTMNFDVADPALLEGLTPGQRIRFEIEHGERTFQIVALEAVNEGVAGRSGSSGGGGLDAVAPEDEPAPPFSLLDQDGTERTLASLSGRVVLLDFVYTSCPGPCPILTALHVQVQRELPEALRERVQLVSISLDPERDTPEAMRAYGEARGADFANWSFLTSDRETIDAVLAAYGVGTAPGDALDEIAHVVVTFLIDAEGNIAKRYFGLDHEADALRADLAALVERSG